MTTTAIERALAFINEQGRPLEFAWARHRCAGGPRRDVLDALAAYQNDDGGFGRGLEVDIKAPDSEPFAARLAMLVLISIGAGPSEPVVRRLAGWLDQAQDDDGCWRFPPGVFEHPLAPWFVGWTFPNLNPALCLAGGATRLGIGTDRLQARVRALADRMASSEEVERGEFYALLAYLEYFPWIVHPRSDAFVTALAARIERTAREGGYADAEHFFEHAGPPDGPIAGRLPADLVAAQLDRLQAEQQADGGWLSPYDPAWRSWATASSAVTLQAYGRV